MSEPSPQVIEYGNTQDAMLHQHVKRHVQSPATTLVQRVEFTTVSNNNASVTILPPSSEYLIDKNVQIELEFTVTGVVADGVTAGLPIGTLRPYPVNRIIRDCSVVVNGTSFSSRPADMIQAMTQYETGGDFFRARVD